MNLPAMKTQPVAQEVDLKDFLPDHVRNLPDLQTALPRLAKDPKVTASIEAALRRIPTKHYLHHEDSRIMTFLKSESVHLVVTSPPYWTLKEYRDHENQLGAIEDYDQFLGELDKVWRQCFRALVPGGRLICVVGDVCLSRRDRKSVV